MVWSDWRSLGATMALAAAAAGCGGGDQGGGSTEPSGSISITVSPASLTLAQGQDGSITVMLVRAGGFSGSVTISAQGLPSGVTLAGATLASGSSSMQLDVQTSGSASVGVANVTLRAMGTGVTVATTTLSLTIQVSAQNGFNPSIAVPSLDVEQGGSQDTTIDVNRASGFTGAVTFSSRNVPNLLTVSFDPTVVTGEETTLTLEADAALVVGDYEITIDAAVDDPVALPVTEPARQTDRVVKSFDFPVRITEAGGSGGTGDLAWMFCEQSGFPPFVAAKSGHGGNWTRLQPNGNGMTYSFDPAPMSGIAWVMDDVATGHTSVNMWFGDRQFLETVLSDLCVGNGLTRTVMGSVAGVGLTEQALISMGRSSAFVGFGMGSFTLPTVDDGVPVDLLAVRQGFTGMAFETDRLIRRSNLDPPSGSTLQLPLDFTGPEAFDPVVGGVTVSNAGGSTVAISTALFADGQEVGLISQGFGPAGPPQPFLGIPLSRQMSGDLQLLNGTSVPSLMDLSTRGASIYVRDPTVPQTLDLRPGLSSVTVSVPQAAPNSLMRVQHTRQADYEDAFSFGAVQNGGSTSRGFNAVFQGDYFNGDVDFTMPDLRGVNGWNPIWDLSPGSETTWSFAAFTHDWSGGPFTGPQEGDRSWTALEAGTITP